MAKLAPTSIKYIIKGRIKAKGVIERPDVIGAVFGQTEGLLGSDLDLRELQQAGKIGRIEVKISSENGTSEGEITIPSALDAADTSLIAATLETIERIGPCSAKIILEKVDDVRSEKRQYVMDKAKEILKGLMDSGDEASEISEHIKESVRTHEITSYQEIPCGPDMKESEEVILVEGRADIIHLLKYGIRNTVAVGGTSIPATVVELAKQKITTLFVDGDRGGQLIAKELMQKTDLDFVATAPDGKEVEEIAKKEVFNALRNKVPADQYQKTGLRKKFKTHSQRRGFRDRPERKQFKPKISAKEKELFKKTLEELVGTRAACIFSADYKLLGKVPVTELQNTLRTMETPAIVVFDGKVDFQLNSIARRKGVKFLVGMDKEDLHSNIAILSRKDLE